MFTRLTHAVAAVRRFFDRPTGQRLTQIVRVFVTALAAQPAIAALISGHPVERQAIVAAIVAAVEVVVGAEAPPLLRLVRWATLHRLTTTGTPGTGHTVTGTLLDVLHEVERLAEGAPAKPADPPVSVAPATAAAGAATTVTYTVTPGPAATPAVGGSSIPAASSSDVGSPIPADAPAPTALPAQPDTDTPPAPITVPTSPPAAPAGAIPAVPPAAPPPVPAPAPVPAAPVADPTPAPAPTPASEPAPSPHAGDVQASPYTG